METTCENCGQIFVLTKEQEELVNDSANVGTNFIVSRCPICHRNISLHPLSLLGIPHEDVVIEDNRLFYCPTAQCIGFVEYNDDDRVYECVECGSTWNTKDELFDDITKIVNKYPHRKGVYKKVKNGWKSIPFGTSPYNYGTMVQNDETD